MANTPDAKKLSEIDALLAALKSTKDHAQKIKNAEDGADAAAADAEQIIKSK